MLKTFFNPRTVAIVGVSRKREKIGRIIFDQVVKSGFKGKVYPVNPNAKRIGKYKCYPSILHIKDKIDLAVIAVPADVSLKVVEECIKKGVKSIILISGGFSELGNKIGKKREKVLKNLLSKGECRLLGPNMIGVYDAHTKLDTVFLKKDKLPRPPPGSIAFISQSGAIGAAVLDYLSKKGIGISKFVSYGNAADVNETDLIEFLGKDSKTHVITSYIEGIKGDGKKFISICKRVTKKKPILILKAGKTRIGRRAVASHTGSMAGSSRIYSAAFKQCGIIEVETIEELFEFGKAFVMQPLPKGNRLCIVTNGGGFGVLATDEAERQGIALPDLSEGLRRKLKRKMPEHVILHNPLDVTGDTTTERYKIVLKEIIRSKEFDGILVIIITQVPLLDETIADVLIRMNEKSKIPIIVCSTSTKLSEKLEKNNIPCYFLPEKAVKAFALMVRYSAWKHS